MLLGEWQPPYCTLEPSGQTQPTDCSIPPCPSLAGDEDGPVAAADLAPFLRDHFFKDPHLAKQHPGTGKAYWAALARLVLKRFLLLAALLDRVAALPTLPPGAPLLFRRDSKLKSSAQVPWSCMRVAAGLFGAGLLQAGRSCGGMLTTPTCPSCQALAEFCLPRLAGEGDVARTLARMGYKLSYVQDPRQELDFAGGWL